MRIVRWAGLFLIGVLAAAAQHTPRFALHPGDRVVFYGDSITDQRLYTIFTETYVVTRFPQLAVTFVHSGWGGDRVTGGAGGPIDVRLPRDVFAYHPTVLTIMLGMNDGGYKAFDQAAFDTYAAGYRHIVDAARQADPGVRITVLQPSPYDDITRAPNFPGGYNVVLQRYSRFLADLAQTDHLGLADLNDPVVADLERAKEINPELAAKLIPDRVHPGPAGHWLMAEALLKAWHAPALVAAVTIDGASRKLSQASGAQVTALSNTWPLTWTELDQALPLPLNFKDPQIALAVHASDLLDALDQEPLRVNGLAPGHYKLTIDDTAVGSFTQDELAAGINLATLPTPMSREAAKVYELTVAHANVHNFRWRTLQVPFTVAPPPHLEDTLHSLDELEAEIVAQQHQAAQPQPHHFRLEAE